MAVWVKCEISCIKEGARWNVLLRFPFTLIYWAHSYTDVELLNQTAREKKRGMAFGKKWTENAASNKIRNEIYGVSLQEGGGYASVLHNNMSILNVNFLENVCTRKI